MNEAQLRDPAERAKYSRALGIRLQRLRIARRLTQEQVAELANISPYTYQKFEKGESKPGTPMNPRMYTLLSLSRIFEVSLDELLNGEE